MKYKLIATDMDGTLLNDEHLISEGNIEAIKEIQKTSVLCIDLKSCVDFAKEFYRKKGEINS